VKVLHVIPGLTHERGGPSVVLHALVRHQSARGHQVAVLTTDQGARHGERPVELPEGVLVERLAVRGPDRLAYAPGFTRALRHHLRSVDLVHVHSVFTHPVHAALREAHRAGVPVVLRPCGHLHRYSLRRSAWTKWAYLALWGWAVRRACTAWHYTSANERDESWPWRPAPHFVLPNGIEPADYALEPEQAREIVGRTWPHVGRSPYVLFLGRLHPKKRLDLLIEAFLRGVPEPYQLVVAGPDECRLWPRLGAALLCRAQDQARVVRVGLVGGQAKAALLAGADLFALPSQHENFGNAALEALAAGTPVLLSPHVDLAEAACAAGLGETAPLTTTAWSEHLARALDRPEALEAARSRARRWAAQHYSWDRIVRELTERYHWVSAGCRRQGIS
jgi:glycosyltransferase involved in cell wall biosynthesis